MFHVEHAKNPNDNYSHLGFLHFSANANENHSHLTFLNFWRGGASSRSTIVFAWASKTCDQLPTNWSSLFLTLSARGRQ